MQQAPSDPLRAQRWQRLKGLLAQALVLPAAQRTARLRQLAADTAEARELQALAAAAATSSSLLDRGARGWLSDLQQAEADAAAPHPPPIDGSDAALSGRRVGPYELLAWVAAGGMGQVYRARRVPEQPGGAPGPVVALKLMRQGVADVPFARRFQVERAALARLAHPNLARLLDAGMDGERPWLVMEFVDGEPIDRHCQRHGLSVAEVLVLFRSLCHAVQHAHRQGVVHRDIKPANVLVTADGVVKLVDFGIAKQLDAGPDSATATATAMRLMTLAFASPEQVRGQPVTPASDLYSLGVLLHHLVTGQSPYRGVAPGDDLALRNAVCRQVPRRPSRLMRGALRHAAAQGTGGSGRQDADRQRLVDRLRPGLTRDVDRLLLALLQKDPARRPASAAVVARDLYQLQRGRPLRRGTGRSATARHALAAVAAVAVVAAASAGWRHHQEAQAAAQRRARAAPLVQDLLARQQRPAGDAGPFDDPESAVRLLQAAGPSGADPAWPARRALGLAAARAELSAVLLHEGRVADARAAARQAVADAREADGAEPAAQRRALAIALLALADALPPAEASAWRAALDEARALATWQDGAGGPDTVAAQSLLAHVDASFGRYFMRNASVEPDAAGRAAAALAASIERLLAMPAEGAAVPRRALQLSGLRLALADAWLRAGRSADAAEAARQAWASLQAAAHGQGAEQAVGLSALALRAGDVALAISAAEWALGAFASPPELAARRHPRERLRHAQAHQALGQALTERSLRDEGRPAGRAVASTADDWHRACAAYRSALSLLQPLAPRWPDDPWVPDGAAVLEMRLFLRACPNA